MEGFEIVGVCEEGIEGFGMFNETLVEIGEDDPVSVAVATFMVIPTNRNNIIIITVIFFDIINVPQKTPITIILILIHHIREIS
ncbi:hypothetical protein ACKUB1_12590 [Methanospirillum stamsii]|uniref:Uncharacterized protein n=1 Tax=Methanospirillum stamsii TaxID=1277351 RepID=A0A2V2N8J9_9EURY|nr:hypothetical protein [Methanospirillum stamsii]PWR76332.1 hypothetical protein DLD82_00550 [Methanospirillum stamsii]